MLTGAETGRHLKTIKSSNPGLYRAKSGQDLVMTDDGEWKQPILFYSAILKFGIFM